MHAHLEIIVCKFGRNPAICLVEEGICAKCLQTDGQTDDGRRAIALATQKHQNFGFHDLIANIYGRERDIVDRKSPT